jgi:conjugal transfer pilus assembly protein TraL
MSPIPKTLDDPPKMLFWDLDQSLVFFSMIVLGILANMTATLGAVGLFVAYLYGKLKGGKHRGFAKHVMYWVTPITFGMRRTPPSHIRQFLG